MDSKSAILAIIANQYGTVKDAGRQLDLEFKELKRERLAAINREFDAQVWRAHKDVGVSISAIAQAMGTTNRARVYQSIRNAESYAPALPSFDPLAQRYARAENGDIVVTLTPEDIGPIMTRFKQDTVWGDRPTPTTGRFELHPVAGWQWADGQEHILRDPVEPARWIEHPVMLWFESPANKAELIEWAGK